MCGGLLRIGEAMAPPLIKKVKNASKNSDIRIIDAPPGTSCPVIEAMEGCDYVVLVAEPTPFGLFDLQLAVQLMHKLHFPFGVVINREGMGDEKVEEYLHKENVPILARLPHTDAAATAYSKGKLLIEEFPEFDQYFEELWKNISANQKA
jgi:MinD superfamily P-loop ATPase